MNDALYKHFLKTNPLLVYIPKEDVLQEIAAALHLYHDDNASFFKEASSKINALTRDYGYSRKRGKDNFQEFYKKVEFEDASKELLDFIEFLYLNSSLTCKEVCDILDIQYSARIQKLFHEAYPKDMGHGGKRRKSYKQ